MKIGLILLNTVRRSKIAFVLSLLGGMMLCLVFTAMSRATENMQARVNLGLYDRDNSAVSEDFKQFLHSSLGYELLELDDLDKLDTELVERHICGIVEVPQGFEAGLLANQPIPLKTTFLDDYANEAFTRGYLENYTATVYMLAGASGGDKQEFASLLDAVENHPIEVSMVDFPGKDLELDSQESGLLLTFGFFLMISFMAGIVFANLLQTDRTNGTYMRVKGSAVTSLEYITGIGLAGFFCALILVVPFLLFIGIKAPGIHLPLGPAIAFCLLYALFVVGMSLLAGLFLNTTSAINALMIGISTVGCLLGGAFFPIESSPLFLQKLARIMPQYWFMDGINRLISGSTQWVANAAIVGMFAVLCFLLAGIYFAKSHTTAKA